MSKDTDSVLDVISLEAEMAPCLPLIAAMKRRAVKVWSGSRNYWRSNFLDDEGFSAASMSLNDFMRTKGYIGKDKRWHLPMEYYRWFLDSDVRPYPLRRYGSYGNIWTREFIPYLTEKWQTENLEGYY